MTAIQHGLSTGSAESIRLNGSEYTENLTTLAAEKAQREQLGLGEPEGPGNVSQDDGDEEE